MPPASNAGSRLGKLDGQISSSLPLPNMKKSESNETVKTSLKLPRRLWREARILALDDGREFQEIVAAALDAYLAGRRKGGKS